MKLSPYHKRLILELILSNAKLGKNGPERRNYVMHNSRFEPSYLKKAFIHGISSCGVSDNVYISIVNDFLEMNWNTFMRTYPDIFQGSQNGFCFYKLSEANQQKCRDSISAIIGNGDNFASEPDKIQFEPGLSDEINQWYKTSRRESASKKIQYNLEFRHAINNSEGNTREVDYLLSIDWDKSMLLQVGIFLWTRGESLPQAISDTIKLLRMEGALLCFVVLTRMEMASTAEKLSFRRINIFTWNKFQNFLNRLTSDTRSNAPSHGIIQFHDPRSNEYLFMQSLIEKYFPPKTVKPFISLLRTETETGRYMADVFMEINTEDKPGLFSRIRSELSAAFPQSRYLNYFPEEGNKN